MLQFDLPKNQSSIIKVIGVGGGGSNAVTHMYRQGIKGVDFIICNTDAQAMESSPVPTKIQLGANLTGGLGAGAVPSIGKNSALENVQDIPLLSTNDIRLLIAKEIRSRDDYTCDDKRFEQLEKRHSQRQRDIDRYYNFNVPK